MAWTVPRLQGRHQGITASLQGRPRQRGKGATFYLFSVLHHGNPPRADESEVEFLPRGGAMEAIQTPKPVAVGGRDQIFVHLDDGFRVDGTWYNHGLSHRMS